MRLYNITPDEMKSATGEKLKKEIHETQPLSNKDWLLAQYEKLEKNGR